MKKVRTFEQILEDVQTMNSDKETKLKDYQDKINYYNANKSKFMGILKSRKQDIWETEANKIIKGNVYLGKKWSLDKMQFNIENDLKKIASNEMTTEEEKETRLKSSENQIELSKDKAALDKQIKEDLKEIQAL